jgi:septation ring formation regulator EzrA
MRKKMEKEMRKSQIIDDAFKSIKTATGVTDVQEMVKKFLSREQTYSMLLVNVSDSDRKSDKLKKDNEELRARLHELKIDAEALEKNAEVGDKAAETKF